MLNFAPDWTRTAESTSWADALVVAASVVVKQNIPTLETQIVVITWIFLWIDVLRLQVEETFTDR